MAATDEKKTEVKPSGICARCGNPLDDHDGWFSKKGLFCRVSARGGIYA